MKNTKATGHLVWFLALAGSWTWFVVQSRPVSSDGQTVGVNRASRTPESFGKKGPSSVDSPQMRSDAPTLTSGEWTNDVAAYLARIQALDRDSFQAEFESLRKSRAAMSNISFRATTGAGRIEREDVYFKLLLGRWGELDPDGALRAIAGQDNPRPTAVEKTKYEALVLEGWARKEPNQAWQWAQTKIEALPAAEQRDYAVASGTAIAAALLESGEYRSVADLLANTQSRALQSAAESFLVGPIGTAWARSDVRAAMNWAVGLPANSTGRLGALSGITQGIGGDGAEVTLRLVSSMDNVEDARFAALGAVKYFSDRNESEEAFKWLNTLATAGNDGGRYDQAIVNYFTLLQAGPENVDAEHILLTKIQTPVDRERAATQFVNKRWNLRPELAMRTVLSYFPAARREAGAIDLAKKWAAADSGRAMAYISEYPEIPGELRAKLLAALKPAE